MERGWGRSGEPSLYWWGIWIINSTFRIYSYCWVLFGPLGPIRSNSFYLVVFGLLGSFSSYSVHFVPFYADWSISVHSVLLGLFRSNSVLLGLFGPFRSMVFFRVLANKNKQQPNQVLPRHPKKQSRRSLSLFVCSENPGKYKRKLKDKKESFVIFSLYYYYYFSFKTTWNESDKSFSRRKVDCVFLIRKSYFIFNNLLWF